MAVTQRTMGRLGEESCSWIRRTMGRWAAPNSRSYLRLSAVRIHSHPPILELEDDLEPVPLFVEEAWLGHHLPCDLPQNEPPVVDDPLLGDKVAAFNLQPLKGLCSAKMTPVLADELIVLAVCEVEAPYLVGSGVSGCRAARSQSHLAQFNGLVEARVEERCTHSLAIWRN